MPAAALALALGAAFVHAVWNVAVARARDPEVAMALALPLAVLAFALPAAAAGEVGSQAIPYIAASSLLELTYVVLLAAAYRRAELSVVYPLSRGLAPVLVLVVGAAALGAGASVGQVAGVLLVAAGIVMVRDLRRAGDMTDVGLALAIAGCIAGYTLVDKEGLEHADPLPYLELVLAGPALIYLLAMWQRKGATALRAELSAATLLTGVAIFGSYALVLAALQSGPAAPVAAVRESSVVIATAMAALFLAEDVGRRRLAGAAVVAGGVAVLGLA